MPRKLTRPVEQEIPRTITNLKAVRERRGATAAELAARIGISRQTIYAIEAGTYVPNTSVALQLARALDVSVEDLFSLAPTGEPDRVIRAELLGSAAGKGSVVEVCEVGRRTIAVPAPVSPMWLPVGDAIISHHQAGSRKASISLLGGMQGPENGLLIAGCDPALSVLAQMLRNHGVHSVIIPASSGKALGWLKEGRIHIAGTHLRDYEHKVDNLPAVHKRFRTGACKLVTFAAWEEGLVVAHGNPKAVRSVADLARPDVAIVNRDTGAGSRRLLDRHLKVLGIDHEKVRGYERLAPGHLPASAAVASGDVDCCVATQAAAQAFGLDFLPLESERFDLVVPTRYLELPAVRIMLDILNRSSLRRSLAGYAGYGTQETGKVQE